MLSEEGLDRAACRIAMMRFFPARDDAARALLLVELAAMCETDNHAQWLAIRAGQVFNEWPGLRELRALYCKRFKPCDGQEVVSGVYLDGFPSEQELGPLEIPGLPAPARALPVAPPKMREISAAPDMAQLVAECAAAATIPVRKVRSIEEIEAELYRKHAVKGASGV